MPRYFVYTLLSLLGFQTAISQQFAELPVPDSLVKTLHVRSVTKNFFSTKKIHYISETWYFTPDAMLREKHTLFDTSYAFKKLINKFNYDDSGRLCLVIQEFVPWKDLGQSAHHWDSVNVSESRFSHQDGCSVGVYYNKFNQVAIMDTFFYKNPLNRTRVGYNANQQKRFLSVETLEMPNVLKKKTLTDFDSTGKSHVIFTWDFVNFFNKKRVLTESLMMTGLCTTNLFFRYYKNGLLKSVKAKDCFNNWYLTYEYY